MEVIFCGNPNNRNAFVIVHTETKYICHIIKNIHGLYADGQSTIQ